MAKIPLRPSRLKIRRKSPRWIILHHTAEMYDWPEANIDNQKFQFNYLFNTVLKNKDVDINYHYVIDKVKDDYTAIVTRPIVAMCDWPDIPDDINKRAIHVALMGSYDLKIPEKRMYEVLAFRLLNPMLKLFSMPPDRIRLHKEVSNEEITCPGDFIDKNKIIAMVRRFIIK
jgi:hypothetical protein